MVNLFTDGGCYNGMRVAQDGAGQGTRNYLHTVGDANVNVDNTKHIILAFNFDADDMNESTTVMLLRWRNVTDSGSFAEVTSSGEIKWATDSDLINNNAVVSGEDCGANSINCTTKGWSHGDGVEREGANSLSFFFTQDVFYDFHWSIDLSGTDPDDQYEFEIVDDSTDFMALGATKITVKDPLSLIAESRDDDDNLVVSCGANLLERTGSFPYTYTQIDSATTDGTLGTHTFLFLSTNNMRIFYLKELTPDQWDMSDEVTGA